MAFKIYLIALFSSIYITGLSAQTDFLDIIEDQTNIREQPSTDAAITVHVVRGQKCNVSRQSDFFETVGNQTDFWYEVTADGKKGWVFGAHTTKKLSNNAQTTVLTFKRAERDGSSLHLFFESPKIENQGWKGHGTGVWDFGYGDNQNKYGSVKLYKGGNKTGDLSIPSAKGVSYTVVWKVAPQTDADTRLSTDKEVPIIVSIEKIKATKAPKEKGGKPEKVVPSKSF